MIPKTPILVGQIQGSEQLLPGYLKCCQNFITEVTESCNTAIERKFCELSEYVKYQKVRPLIKSTDVF